MLTEPKSWPVNYGSAVSHIFLSIIVQSKKTDPSFWILHSSILHSSILMMS